MTMITATVIMIKFNSKGFERTFLISCVNLNISKAKSEVAKNRYPPHDEITIIKGFPVSIGYPKHLDIIKTTLNHFETTDKKISINPKVKALYTPIISANNSTGNIAENTVKTMCIMVNIVCKILSPLRS